MQVRGGQKAASSAHQIVDGRCGGCVLVIRGECGATGALGFVRREWLQLRRGQERFYLAEELRTRLGCAAVECLGAPLSTDDQCAALLALLHSTPDRYSCLRRMAAVWPMSSS